jgi:class III cytochrome C family protein
MATPYRTQKQIAERYKGNLGYYKKVHPWRRARRLVTAIFIIGGIAAIWIYQTRGRETFFSAGKLSAEHAGFGNNCASCHDKALMTEGPLTPKTFRAIVKERFRNGIPFESIDQKCQTCHTHHAFHEPNVVQNRSCSACHQEHQGPGPMKLVASSNCASCHSNRAAMDLAAQKGMQFNWANFNRHPQPVQRVVFELPRPPRGYTQVFSSFWDEHPEFQVNTAKLRDPDALRFNHQRHFANDIPLVNGQKLDCNYCHKPDTEGRFMHRISFAANCQACHSLQFDPKNPELTLPHGNAIAVRGFLRSLPTQYADLAVKKGITQTSEIQSFVGKQMAQLRERVRSGEDFERQIFFTADPYKPQRTGDPRTRGSFYGCAFCHEVKAVANTAPAITKPILVDRWMVRSDFDHAKHMSVKCDDCHHAMQSRETFDVLMPTKANCVGCHSPQGKVVAECVTCHTYHAPPQTATSKQVASFDHFGVVDLGPSPGSPLKQMLLGGITSTSQPSQSFR